MLENTVTHYFPWDDTNDHAYCGKPMGAADIHSPLPTCPACGERLLALDAAIEETPLPLDADEAATELDPILNAGIPAHALLSPLGAELFALANTLNALALTRLLDEAVAS
jgi:hypothetical protein